MLMARWTKALKMKLVFNLVLVMGNKMSMTSKFSKDVIVESKFAAPVKEVNSGVHSCILKDEFDFVRSNSRVVDKGMKSVHLQLLSIVDVLTNNKAAFFGVVEHA